MACTLGLAAAVGYGINSRGQERTAAERQQEAAARQRAETGNEVDKSLADAAQLNDAAAMAALGDCRKAAKAGSMDGQLAYGKCLLHGSGVARSEGLAKAWFAKAARQGSAAAQDLPGRWTKTE
jgi:TPR repeat protein